MDGSITIKTKIDNSKSKQQLEELEGKIKIQGEKYKDTKDSINQVNQSLKNSNKELENMEKKYNSISSKIKKMEAQASTPKGLSTGGYSDLENYKKERDSLATSIEKVISKIQKEEQQQKKLNIKLKEQEIQYKKLISSKQKLESKNMGVGADVSKMTTGLKSGLKTLSKYALALFGIQTIYSALSSAANSWLSSNDIAARQLSADIEYMKWAIGKSLQPVIETLVQWIYKLLSLINAVANALFKVNLFSKASAKDFESANKSSSGIAKNTKEASNNLASFDKIDVLKDDTSNTSGGGGADFTAPSIDLGGIDDIEIPEWMQWILDNGDIIIAVISGVGIALGLLKLGVDLLIALGIGVAVAGLIILIKSVMDYLEDPTWQNFAKIIIGLGLVIAGVALAFGEWPIVLAGVIAVIIGLLISNWSKVKDFILGIAKWIEENFGILGEEISRIIKDGLENFEIFYTGIKQIFDGIIQIARGDFAGGLKTIFIGILNIIITALNSMITQFNMILSPARALIVAFGKATGKNWTMSNIKIPSISRVQLAKGAIVSNPRRGVDTTIGEDGTEMVLPIEKNTGWMDILADKIASRNGNGNITIKANGTLAQLIRLLKLELDKEDSRVGTSLIIGGSA